MNCPFCSAANSRVVDSRVIEDGKSIRRRRECTECGKRFTTYERIEEAPLIIVKKDGKREIFDRGKLLRGLLRACEKRPVSLESLEEICAETEKELRNIPDKEVSSSVVGEVVMEKLRAVDDVAYVRFASVYREFKDIGKFLKEIEGLAKKKNS